MKEKEIEILNNKLSFYCTLLDDAIKNYAELEYEYFKVLNELNHLKIKVTTDE